MEAHAGRDGGLAHDRVVAGDLCAQEQGRGVWRREPAWKVEPARARNCGPKYGAGARCLEVEGDADSYAAGSSTEQIRLGKKREKEKKKKGIVRCEVYGVLTPCLKP